MPLLDADLTSNAQQRPAWLNQVLWPTIAGFGVAVALIFLIAPKPATQTVREIVQAAEELLERDPPRAASEQETDTNLWTHRKTKRRRHANVSDIPTTSLQRLPRHATEPVDSVPPERTSVHMVDLTPGIARASVRHLLGDPDVIMYKLEKNHEVENFVYVDRLQSSATTVLLMDGRVVSVETGTPVVRASHPEQKR